jgi:transcriptional activator HAC1
MVAMRLASEQQLTPACLSGVDASRSDGGKNSPTFEALTTLLWATHSISIEDAKGQAKLDVATEVRQACDELDELFRQRKITTASPVPIVERGDEPKGQKSLEGWRLARP